MLLGALLVAKPRGTGLREALRLLPDLLRLARDGSLRRCIRLRPWLLLGYLALPIDLVPDVIPVLGDADDAMLVALVLRTVVRRSGVPAIEQHWLGTPDGLAGLLRLCAADRPSIHTAQEPS